MMENVTLEGVVERLDRLEKVVTNINMQLSLLVKELVADSAEKSKQVRKRRRVVCTVTRVMLTLPRKSLPKYMKKWVFHLTLNLGPLKNFMKV